MQRTLLRAVLHGIVEQIEYHVGKVHLVDLDQPVERVELRGDAAPVFLDFEFEGVDDVVHREVGVDFLELECGALAVEQRHLQHLLDLESQPLGLVGHHCGDLLEHRG